MNNKILNGIIKIIFLILLLSLFAWMVRYESIKQFPKKETIQIEQQKLKISQLSKFIQSRVSTIPVEYSMVIAQNIIAVSDEYDIPVDLIVGIIEKESCWNASTVSSAGARGLMQILRGETVTVDIEQAHNIYYNLSTGCEILRGKIKVAKGDLNLALNNYSGGATGYVEGVLICVGRWILFKQNIKDN